MAWAWDKDGSTLGDYDIGPGDPALDVLGSVLAPPPPPPPPPHAPSAPRSVNAATGNARATLHWLAPSDNGGASVTAYVVTPLLGSTAQPPHVFNTTKTAATVTGLTNGRALRFKVAARNSAGTGPSSPASSVLTIGAPGQPAPPMVTKVGAGTLKLQFAAPASNGAAIESYLVGCVPAGGGAAKGKRGSQSPITLYGLTPATKYRCTVRATNSRGSGGASAPSSGIVA